MGEVSLSWLPQVPPLRKSLLFVYILLGMIDHGFLGSRLIKGEKRPGIGGG